MKKTYIRPITNAVQTSQIKPIAGSLTETSATFYQKDAIDDAMTHEDKGWDIWSDD